MNVFLLSRIGSLIASQFNASYVHCWLFSLSFSLDHWLITAELWWRGLFGCFHCYWWRSLSAPRNKLSQIIAETTLTCKKPTARVALLSALLHRRIWVCWHNCMFNIVHSLINCSSMQRDVSRYGQKLRKINYWGRRWYALRMFDIPPVTCTVQLYMCLCDYSVYSFV